MDWKERVAWKELITFARTAQGKQFFPLDEKLKLSTDHWSEGAARVAARQGLQGKSFDLAAEAYSDATGGSISGDSLARITEAFGTVLENKHLAEAKKVYAAEVPPPVEQVVSVQAPICTQANLSTDGGMILIRAEGWKEVKMSVISEVKVISVPPTPENAQPDPKITLKRHSYQVGLWSADEMMQHQYLEGARRQVEGCPRLGSVNDGAVWIDRITTTNYSRAIQVIDWGHAVNVSGKWPRLLLAKVLPKPSAGLKSNWSSCGLVELKKC